MQRRSLADEGERRQKALPTFRREFKRDATQQRPGLGLAAELSSFWWGWREGEGSGGGCYVARILKSIKYARDCFTT